MPGQFGYRLRCGAELSSLTNLLKVGFFAASPMTSEKKFLKKNKASLKKKITQISVDKGFEGHFSKKDSF